MNARAVQSAPAQSAHRAYTIKQLVVLLAMSRRTFFELRSKGRLPFLKELEPRLGRVVRYRADLVDRYLAGEWNQPRSFASHRRSHVGIVACHNPQL